MSFIDAKGHKVHCGNCVNFTVDEETPLYGTCRLALGMFGAYTRQCDICQKHEYNTKFKSKTEQCKTKRKRNVDSRIKDLTGENGHGTVRNKEGI